MDKSLLEPLLSPPLDLVCLEEIGSTNTIAAELVKSGRAPRDTLVTAARQTAGRGRAGRQFFSPDGGIYMSLITRPALSPEQALLVTPAAAVAVRRAIKKICRQNCGIKWVNDIEKEGKKLCGILTESVAGALIIGVGVNFRHSAPLPPELAAIATCLYADEPETEKERLAAEIINELSALIAILPDIGFLREYREHSTLLGRPITVRTANSSYDAVALEIDDRAGLVVQTASGARQTLSAGEVSIRPATK